MRVVRRARLERGGIQSRRRRRPFDRRDSVVVSPSETSFAGWADTRETRNGTTALASAGDGRVLRRCPDIADRVSDAVQPGRQDGDGGRATDSSPACPCATPPTPTLFPCRVQLITGETVLAHQVRYAGRSERTRPRAPAWRSVTGASISTAYPPVQPAYRVLRVDGHDEAGEMFRGEGVKGSTAKGFTEAFGAWLDASSRRRRKGH